jgi:MPBQ/MSBQ methyltransferase
MEVNSGNNADVATLREHLHSEYKGVFDDQMIQQHIDEFVDGETAEAFVEDCLSSGARGARMLDIGAGYGALVLSARGKGIDAVGVELADFEVQFARNRLRAHRPADDPDSVYYQGDGMGLPFESDGFDIVTIMNVLEHVPDYKLLLQEAVRVLRPGGKLYILCPNYAAFRREAHYHLPWVPLLPRKLASLYLKALGRNPGFFEQHIFYCTNTGILRALAELPVDRHDPKLEKLRNPERIASPRTRKAVEALRSWGLMGFARGLVSMNFLNPFKKSVDIVATKRGAS